MRVPVVICSAFAVTWAICAPHVGGLSPDAMAFARGFVGVCGVVGFLIAAR
jgi:hypothetical protein